MLPCLRGTVGDIWKSIKYRACIMDHSNLEFFMFRILRTFLSCINCYVYFFLPVLYFLLSHSLLYLISLVPFSASLPTQFYLFFSFLLPKFRLFLLPSLLFPVFFPCIFHSTLPFFRIYFFPYFLSFFIQLLIPLQIRLFIPLFVTSFIHSFLHSSILIQMSSAVF